MLQRILVVGLMLTLLSGLYARDAVAGGGTPYANGAEGFFCGRVPPPGFYFKNYNLFYKAGQMMDNGGHKIDAFDESTVWADILRFVWVTDMKLLGGSCATQVFIPYVDADVRFNAPVGPKNKRHYKDSGIPCIIYTPCIIAYHLFDNRFHWFFTTDIFIPTGGQDNDNLAYVRHNYWTFEPIVSFTFFLTKHWDISSKLMYSFNTTQDDCPTLYGVNADRNPGQEFHLDFSTSYGISDNLRVGLTGYFYKQTTDDDYDLNGSIPFATRQLLKNDEGHKGQVFSVGPGIWYNHKKWFLSLRSQWEMAAKNRTEGAGVWFMFIRSF
jgi:hypothetical protein